jgi:hypothetical protein
MVFLAGGRSGQNDKSKGDIQNQMIVASGKQYANQIPNHGRNNSSDVQGNRRHEDFIKD